MNIVSKSYSEIMGGDHFYWKIEISDDLDCFYDNPLILSTLYLLEPQLFPICTFNENRIFINGFTFPTMNDLLNIFNDFKGYDLNKTIITDFNFMYSRIKSQNDINKSLYIDFYNSNRLLANDKFKILPYFRIIEALLVNRDSLNLTKQLIGKLADLIKTKNL